MATPKKGYMGSTEPQARKVMEGIKKRQPKAKPKKKMMNPTKATAKSPPGVKKTKAQGERERAALRKKQQQRVKTAQKKTKSKRSY